MDRGMRDWGCSGRWAHIREPSWMRMPDRNDTSLSPSERTLLSATSLGGIFFGAIFDQSLLQDERGTILGNLRLIRDVLFLQ